MRAWHQPGQLPPDTLAWSQATSSWQPLVVALGPPAAPPPPPPPPPRAPQGTAAWAAGSSSGGASARPAAAGAWAVPEQGSLGRWLGAVALDVLITYALFLLVAVVTVPLEAISGEAGALLGGVVVIAFIVLLVAWHLLSLGRLGQTYGKHLAGVRVVSVRDHRPIGAGSAFVRQLVQNVGLCAAGLGWFWALWDPRQQGWHDKVVASVVVDASQQQRVDPITHLRAAFRGEW